MYATKRVLVAADITVILAIAIFASQTKLKPDHLKEEGKLPNYEEMIDVTKVFGLLFVLFIGIIAIVFWRVLNAHVANDNGEISDGIKMWLQCSVCLKRFKDPKVLQCHHTFCKTCLETMVVNDNKIPCPQCDAVHNLSADRISGLSTNDTIVSLMAIYQIINELGRSTKLKLGLKHACAETIQSDLTACRHYGDVTCSGCSDSHFTKVKTSVQNRPENL